MEERSAVIQCQPLTGPWLGAGGKQDEAVEETTPAGGRSEWEAGPLLCRAGGWTMVGLRNTHIPGDPAPELIDGGVGGDEKAAF